jgi:hypothetical protein
VAALQRRKPQGGHALMQAAIAFKEFALTLSLSTTLRAGLLLGAAALANPAQADVIYQSATAGASPAQGGFVAQGDGTSGGSNIIGGVFNLTETTIISDIGANFLVSAPGSSSGPIFAEIVQLAAGAKFPGVSVENLVPLARVVFSPTADGDNSTPLSLVLEGGTYAVLFGGNATDATGFATLSDGNTPVGSPSLFEDNFNGAANPWDTFAPLDTRIFVDGTEVPEPATLTLLGAGLAMFGVTRRRRA